MGVRLRTASLRTEVSVAGKRNFEGRDKTAETAVKVQKRRCRDRISINNPAHWGLFGENREISVRTEVRGGARRTRTKDPDSFIDGARRDRCVAEAARARGVRARACRKAGCD